MIYRLKNLLAGTEEKKRLISNVFSLGVLQVANYILPLFTVPYLVRVLGPDYFGLLAFATATNSYFVLLTDYGFNLSATRQVSIHRENKDKINEIFSSVLTIKVALMTISLLCLMVFVFSIKKFNENWEIYLTTFGIVIGQVIFPIWLFQGMEKMKHIAYLNITAKSLFTILIFLFVKTKSDYLLVPLLTAFGFLIVGIWSLIIAKKEFGINFKIQSLTVLKFHLKEGWYVFFSSMAISLYTISTTFILGIFTTNTNVGYFAGVERIVQGVKGLNIPISQSIYPLISAKMQINKNEGILFLKKVSLFIASFMLLLSFTLFVFAEPIVEIFLGKQYENSIVPLRIMAFLPFIVALSNIFGIQTMLNLGYNKEFSFFVVITAIVGVILTLILAPMYNVIGVSVATLTVEILITSMLGFFIYFKFKKGNL